MPPSPPYTLAALLLSLERMTYAISSTAMESCSQSRRYVKCVSTCIGVIHHQLHCTSPQVLNTFGTSIYICAVACLVTVLPVPIAQQAGAPATQSNDPACVMQIEHKQCAFVTFTSRQAAETAAEAMSNRLIIKGNRCRLLWGKPQEKRDAAAAAALSMLPSQVRTLQKPHIRLSL